MRSTPSYVDNVLFLLVIVLVLATSLAGCACSSFEEMLGEGESSDKEGDKEDEGDDKKSDDKEDKEVDGAKLYASKCEGCHGEKGDKTPDFTSKDYAASKKDIAAAIKEGKGTMPAFKKLDEAEVKALVKHVRAFKGGDDKKSGKAGKKDKGDKGAKVDAQKPYDKFCAGCHGEKGDKTPDFTSEDYTASKKDIEKAIREGKGAMPGFDDKLDDAEVKALVKFIQKMN